MRMFAKLALSAALFAAVGASPAFAEEHWHDGGHEGGHFEGHWHGDIHHFHEYDYDHWRGGNWYHGFHDGRVGWWWTVDGIWYSYPAPIYPYPDPYIPPTVVVEPGMPVSPPGVAPAYVYYCPNPVGYYPYIARCFAPWERVASGATVAAPPPVMQPAPAMEPPPAPAGGTREADDRELNALAVEFQNVNLADPYHARIQLRALEKRVNAFRESLYSRGYNAMDILHDADRLEHRIADQRAKLPK